MNARPSLVVPAEAVALVLLMVFVSSAAPAEAGAVGPAATSAQTWAYGAIRTVSFHGSSDGWTYAVSATFGFSVVVTETNLSGSNYALNVSRTMGAFFNVTYSRALSPAVAHLHDHLWETVNATSNLTTVGTVTEPSGPAAAIALTGSQLTVSGGLREAADYSALGVLKLSRALDVNVSASANLSFSPALGLVPLSLTPGTTWNSTSAFTGAGSYAWAVYERSLLLNETYHNSGSGTVNHSGSVTLAGSFTGANVTLQGRPYSEVNYTLTGPFALREGFILIPSSANLFGSSTQPWSTNESGFTNATSPTVDVADHGFAGGHLGFVASGAWFHSSSDNVAAALSGGPSLPGVPAIAPAATDSGSSAFVQGTPESAGQAQSGAACLVTESGCPGGATPRGLLGLLVVTAAVVGTAALIGMAVVARRRQVPPPKYPNASLYPPGQTSSAPLRPATPPSRATKPPTEDDPLDHLW
ncbi:MAG TPA: hypothetical protein VK455_06080 [Thermoplasmata archaeon]|nr:hypothetical protein [Thermoplasmata archaeon]